jgi:hypothetical protein
VRPAGYYEIPQPWRAASLIADYRARCARLGIAASPDVEWYRPGARANELFAALEVILNLCALSAGGDAAATQITVAFVLSDVYFFYSGFARSHAARRLRRAPLTASQIEALRDGIIGMLEQGRSGQEMREFVRLLRKLGLGDALGRAQALMSSRNPRVRALGRSLTLSP